MITCGLWQLRHWQKLSWVQAWWIRWSNSSTKGSWKWVWVTRVFGRSQCPCSLAQMEMPTLGLDRRAVLYSSAHLWLLFFSQRHKIGAKSDLPLLVGRAAEGVSEWASVCMCLRLCVLWKHLCSVLALMQNHIIRFFTCDYVMCTEQTSVSTCYTWSCNCDEAQMNNMYSHMKKKHYSFEKNHIWIA